MAVRKTSADVIAQNSCEEAVGLIAETEEEFPEIRVIPAGAVPNTMYKTLVRTVDPTAGFRAINEGRTRNVGTLVARTVQTFFLDASWDMDNAASRGIDWSDPDQDTKESHFRAAIRALCRQIYYGVSADAGGFAGLGSILANSDDDLVVNAGGTTADTASSVWLLRLGIKDVAFAWGNDGEISMGEVMPVQLYDGNSKPYWGHGQEIAGYCGLQITNHTSMVRIANITEDDGDGLTDLLLSAAMALFKVGQAPNAIFMSRRSAKQLRDSRTATNDTGKEAPLPGDYDGVEIHRTDSIVNTEAVITAAGT
jgi:hypothetical protein